MIKISNETINQEILKIIGNSYHECLDFRSGVRFAEELISKRKCDNCKFLSDCEILDAANKFQGEFSCSIWEQEV